MTFLVNARLLRTADLTWRRNSKKRPIGALRQRTSSRCWKTSLWRRSWKTLATSQRYRRALNSSSLKNSLCRLRSWGCRINMIREIWGKKKKLHHTRTCSRRAGLHTCNWMTHTRALLKRLRMKRFRLSSNMRRLTMQKSKVMLHVLKFKLGLEENVRLLKQIVDDQRRTIDNLEAQKIEK